MTAGAQRGWHWRKVTLATMVWRERMGGRRPSEEAGAGFPGVGRGQMEKEEEREQCLGGHTDEPKEESSRGWPLALGLGSRVDVTPCPRE